jgi:nucleotidyltransferase/DNA polymerase involved in DNA repair
MRVIVHVDLDAFYVQVERQLDPTLAAPVPVAVVQYNSWKGGAIIALSYEAKAMGVKVILWEGRELRDTCMRLETAPRTTVAPEPSAMSATANTADFGDGAVALHDML